MKKIKLLILFLSVYTQIIAQQQPDSAKQRMMDEISKKMIDSITAVRIDEAALMYPVIRQFSISQQSSSTVNIRSKFNDDSRTNGRMQMSRTIANFNLPVWSKNHQTMVASVGFTHQHLDLKELLTNSTAYSITDQNRNISMFNFGLTYNKRDTLLNRPVSLTAMAGGLFDANFSSRLLRFGAVITTPIKATEKSSLTLGLILNIDPSAIIPIVPLISYTYKFKSLDMDLLADLPYRVALRKVVSQKASISVFSETTGNASFLFFEDHKTALPERMTLATTEQKGGLLLEYRLTKKTVFSLSGGINATLQSRVFKVGKRQSDYLISNKTGAMPYVQFGFSVLPFWAPFKR